jgi:hypothetical protein
LVSIPPQPYSMSSGCAPMARTFIRKSAFSRLG